MNTALELAHGFHADVAEGTYHARVPGLVSKHAIDLVRRSPAHYKAWLDGAESEDREAFRLGRATHCALLEPYRFSCEYVVEPEFGDCRKTENKNRRNEWREEHKNAIWLPASDHAAILGMAKAIAAHPVAGKLFTGGHAELTLRWRDAETGLECKARDDYFRDDLGAVIDLKTAENAGAEAFRRSVVNFGYHRQHAHYARGHQALGRPLKNFVFVVVEKAPPYAVAVYSLDSAAEAKGIEQVAEAMRTLAECVRVGRYPGYPENIQTLELPPWAA
ncbi:MAG TPA: PD-(D/E)XK nuclease-like domain-containing protein [Candidatus Tumulicola sp.]|nr:PD-(D/E)XK nuclease-like domain-containing protein [Candidatus Tumulicola sp.]